MSYQKVLILGNAGKDAEVRHLDGGTVVASFSVATAESFKDKSGNRQERTEWHSIKCFGKTAEFAEKYIKKGTSLFIEGKIRTDEYTDKSGNKKFATYILADTIQFAGSKNESDGGQRGSYNNGNNNNNVPDNDCPY